MNLQDWIDDVFAGEISARALVAHRRFRLSEADVQTAAAIERIRRWNRTGRPVPDRDALIFIGDASIGALVDQALEQLPDPVAAHVVENVEVIGVGRDTNGWMRIAPARARTEGQQLVVIANHKDDATLMGIIAHEWAHAWLLPPGVADSPSRDVVRAARENRARIESLADSWRYPSPFAVSEARNELQAATLARAWGFTGFAADLRYHEMLFCAARRQYKESQHEEI